VCAEYRSEALSKESVCPENVKHHSSSSFFYIFACSLFSDAASMPDNIASDDMMISEQ
jgi:hypothetical protein